MSAAGAYLIYCIELYRQAKNLSGRAVYDLFHRTGADEYIRRSFGALHTAGEQYVLDDIDGYVQSRILPLRGTIHV